MKKIRTIGRLPELNPNWREYTPVENATSPEEITHLGLGELKYNISASSSYSQSFQDIFVLSVLNEKKEGTYLELGCSWYVNPKYVKDDLWKRFECKNKRSVNILFNI